MPESKPFELLIFDKTMPDFTRGEYMAAQIVIGTIRRFKGNNTTAPSRVRIIPAYIHELSAKLEEFDQDMRQIAEEIITEL